MIRIYLDWNVLSQLKSQSSNTQDLYQLITDQRDLFCIPYSLAHIQDITYKSSTPSFMIKDRLDYIDKISGCEYLEFDIVSKQTNPYVVSAHQVAEVVTKRTMAKVSYNQYFDDINELTESSYGSIIRKIQKSIPNPFLETDILTDISNVIYKHYENIVKSPSLFDAITHSVELFNTMVTDSSSYDDLRKQLRDLASIKTDHISNSKSPIEYLEKESTRTSTRSNFSVLKELNAIASLNPMYQNKMWMYLSIYLFLDMMGFHSDKFSDKNQVINMLNDAFHSYYAAHCDYFVSFDKQAKQKAKWMYNNFNIDTRVMSPQEFYEDVVSTYKEVTSFRVIQDSILSTLQNNECFINDLSSKDNPDCVVFLYKPIKPIANIFNFLQCYLNKDSNEIHLLRVYKNLSSFIFYSEINSVIAMFVRILGPDNEKRDLLLPDEKENLENFERWWFFEGAFFQVFIDQYNSSVRGVLYLPT